MRVTPFPPQRQGRPQGAMGSVADLLPNMHILFVGPIQCARHTFSALASSENSSILVVTDVETSLGETERLVNEAVDELRAEDPSLRCFVLHTACQGVFLGLDFDALCRSLHERTGLYFAHVEMNRMEAGNIPGPTRRNVPGGDRFHTRRELFKMLAQRGPALEVSRGVLVLCDNELAADNDLRDLTLLDGIDWVRSPQDFDDFGQFLQCADAAAVVTLSMNWHEVGEWVHDEFGIPALYLPAGYALGEVEGACEQLDAALAGYGSAGQRRQLAQRRAQRRAQAQAGVARALRARPSLELDLNNAQRPFSLVEALLGYGFTVGELELSQMRIEHKEDDDAPAYQRLAERFPEWGERFKGVGSLRRGLGMAPGDPGKPGAGGGHGGHGGGPGGVSSETAWWGYSSIVQLMAQIEEAGMQAAPAHDGPHGTPEYGAQPWGWRA